MIINIFVAIQCVDWLRLRHRARPPKSSFHKDFAHGTDAAFFATSARKTPTTATTTKDPKDQTTNSDHDKKEHENGATKEQNMSNPSINRSEKGNRTQTRQQKRKRNTRATQYIFCLGCPNSR